MKRIAALVLALILALCAFGEQETVQEEPVQEAPAERVLLMTVGGKDVYKDQVEEIAYLLYQYNYTDAINMPQGLMYVLLYQVAPALLTEGRETELLGEEKVNELTQQYTDEFNEYFESYVESLSHEGDTDEDKAAHRAQAEKDFADAGRMLDEYVSGMIAEDAFDLYISQLPIEVTEEDVYARYLDYLEEEKAYFEGNIPLYETYQRYGYTLFWQPAGYRGILHILINADENALNAYKEAADDEAKQAAAASVIASVQDTLDEIYKALENGEDFTSLIGKYNIDPGMQNEENLKNGYAVHKDNKTYMEEFTKGAFSEEMQQVGDVSKPVVTSYGVHILYYLRDIPEGAKELTEEFSAELRSELESSRMIDVISEKLRTFPIEYTDAYYDVIGSEMLP